MPGLDDLRRIIRRIETRPPPRAAAEPLERVVGGDLVDTAEGAVLVVRREYPLAHRHGRVALGQATAAPLETLGQVARTEPLPRGGRLLFLDTETTGLAGGTGTYAFLVGAGWFEDDRFVVVQHFLPDLDQEPALLAALAPVLDGADALVTYNGGGFDLPLLETRFVLGRRRWPSALPHLDLLRPARRVWSACFDDCRLSTLERLVLGLERDVDVPGALIPSLYFDWLRQRRAGPLSRVFAHNRDDVLSLAALLGWFAVALGEAPAVSASEWAGLGRLWEAVDVERALVCYRTALAAGLAEDTGHRVRLRLALWEKRAARWHAARELWETARAHGVFDPRPWEELAKYHEHQARDYLTAHSLTTSALGLAADHGAPAPVVEALRHRLGRLQRRLERLS